MEPCGVKLVGLLGPVEAATCPPGHRGTGRRESRVFGSRKLHGPARTPGSYRAAPAQITVPSEVPCSAVCEEMRQPLPFAQFPFAAGLRLLVKGLASGLLILLAIAFIAAWGLILADYGRQHLPAHVLSTGRQALQTTAKYIFAYRQTKNHGMRRCPMARSGGRHAPQERGLADFVDERRTGLGLATRNCGRNGIPQGSFRCRRVLSVLGASTPSFLLAMMLWVVNAWVHRTFDIRVLPSTGFGWDADLIMPVVVLAMRPFAQIAQITYVTLREALQQDYVRTAYAKGRTWVSVRNVHLLPNLLDTNPEHAGVVLALLAGEFHRL